MNLHELLLNEDLSILFPKKRFVLNKESLFLIPSEQYSSSNNNSLLKLINHNLENKLYSKDIQNTIDWNAFDNKNAKIMLGYINHQLKFELMRAELTYDKDKNKALVHLKDAFKNLFTKMKSLQTPLSDKVDNNVMKEFLSKYLHKVKVVIVPSRNYVQLEQKLLQQ